ncbi:MAG: hypothetical protein GXP60_04205 [Epsilonproteobacteria bacterium]|nr:hypothetical protein [Campylobacterota bacterium]
MSLGKRGKLAGTDLRRLNLEKIFALNIKVPVGEIHEKVPPRIKNKLREKITKGGLLSPKSFETLIQILSKIAPETASILTKYSEERIKRIESLSSRSKVALAEQKEAVATALTIAGINRDELLGWDLNENNGTFSFLDGLEQTRLREDPMVVNDLMNLPGYDLIKTVPYNSVVFENDKSKLTIILANRLPLENQLGTDLIYFNETFSCFLMVQYKAMEKETNETVYRFPNNQLTEEIKRMNLILSELKKCSPNTEVDGYRLSENPFFLKICPRIVFNPDSVGLIPGMYLPLEYWELLSEHPTLEGPRGGKYLSYRNVRRYFDNTAFVTMASGGWVGTNIQQSSILKKAIRSTLESGRAVVFAVNFEKDTRHRIDG